MWTTRIDWAEHELATRILGGELAPGTKLKAQDLAEAWDVSPTPIREALQRLTATGLVEAVPNRGMRVAPIVAEELREVYGLRLLLEPFALRATLEARPPGWEVEVNRSFDELEAAFARAPADLVAFESAHAAFHKALVGRAAETWLTRFVETLRAHTTRYRLQSVSLRGGWDGVLEEHRRLRDACLGDDVDAAVAMLFEHIRVTVDAVGEPGDVEQIVERIEAVGRHAHALS